MGNRLGSAQRKQENTKNGKPSYSKSSSVTELPLTTDNTHLETFLLVWLDPHIDTSPENIKTQQRLREILTCLITFNKVDTCEKWIKKCCTDEKIILIVSGAFGQEIVPKIHSLDTIITIYIYCLDVNRNKKWAKNYSKIRSVISVTNELIHELSQHQTKLESVEDSKALKIYKKEQEIHSLDIRTASFIGFQLLLEILISPIYLPSKATFKNFIQILRQYSSDDEYGLNLISEFEQTYEPKKAVLWLTRDTPLTRFVNKALREQDINMLFALRFFLIDIHSQLNTNQSQSINVFKLQPMLKSEMENLKANPGKLMTINGFIFASTNMPQLISTITNDDQFEMVLFDIKADLHPGVAPFAFLHHIDSNIEVQIDREILFMCGSTFEIGSLIYEGTIWRLQLKLVGENDASTLFNMKEKLKETENLGIIADLFDQCHQEDKAIHYYENLLNELPKQHNLIPHINEILSKKKLKSTQIPNISNISFVLINLSEHMTKFSTAVLDILCSLTSKLIFILNNESTIDLSQWNKNSTSIFTTKQFLSSSQELPNHFKIFLLDNMDNNIDQQRFSTIDDLICQLADEIIQMYRSEANKCKTHGDLSKVEEYNQQANQIYHELRNIDDKLHTINSSLSKSDNTAPILIWILSQTEDNRDPDYIGKSFKDYFSSYLTFYNEYDCHLYLAEGNQINIFLIIDINYREKISTGIRHFSNIKYVYRYGKTEQNDNGKIITNRNNLCYRLTYDLIDYYGKLGELYRINNQSKPAKNMFLKAQNLCRLLSSNCFSYE